MCRHYFLLNPLTVFLHRTLNCISKLAPRATRAATAALATAQQDRLRLSRQSPYALPEQTPHPAPKDVAGSEFNSSIEFITTFLPKTKISSDIAPSAIHNAYNHPPIITKGEITPKIIMEFEQACQTFFDNAKGSVPDNQKVARILPAFKDTLICNWIASSRNELTAFTFEDFLTEL